MKETKCLVDKAATASLFEETLVGKIKEMEDINLAAWRHKVRQERTEDFEEKRQRMNRMLFQREVMKAGRLSMF